MQDTKTAEMSWIPTRKKDNEYEELLPRRTNCSSRNNKKTSEEEETRSQAAARAAYNKKRKLRKKPLGSCVSCDRMRMIEGTNTVKLCAKGFESHPTGIDLHRSFGKAVEETCSAASGAVGRLQMHTGWSCEKEGSRTDTSSQRFMDIHETVPFELSSDFQFMKD
jgi:hypothetical protein